MEDEIKVRATEEIRVYNLSSNTLLYEVAEGEELTALLFEPTEEYFATNAAGQEVYVGECSRDGFVILEPEFERVKEA